MTISSTASEISYAGDDVSVAFAIPFPFDTSADVKVRRTNDTTGSIESLTTGFAVTGGGGSTGTCTFTVAPESGYTITLFDDPALTQPVDYTANDAFAAETHEGALDRTVRQVKRLYQQVRRSLRTADGDPITDLTLGSVDNRKGKYLFFDEITGAIEYAIPTDSTALSRSVIADLLFPQTGGESGADITPTNRHFTASPDGATNVCRYMDASQLADFLAGTGLVDQTSAFNAAHLTGKKVWAPAGVYRVSSIELDDDGCWFEGEGNPRYGHTTLLVGTNGAGAFRTQDEFCFFTTIKNFRIKAATGITNARAVLQTDKTGYMAYALFENVETYKDLLISYDVYVLGSKWRDCTDGYSGTPPGGQQHQMISCVPAAFGQQNPTNLNQVVGTRVFGATSGVSAAIDVAYGGTWSFTEGCHFENMDAPAIRARGIFNGTIDDAWFENIRATNVFGLADSDAPNAQGCRAWNFSNSRLSLIGFTGTEAISLSGNAALSLSNIAATDIASGVTLLEAADSAYVKYMCNVVPISGAGAGAFLGTLPRVESSSFIGTVTGVSTTVTGTIRYERNMHDVTLFIPSGMSGTSNAATCTITGMSASLYPARTQGNNLALVADNGTAAVGVLQVSTSGVITAFRSITATGSDWTASGTKRIDACNFKYSTQ